NTSPAVSTSRTIARLAFVLCMNFISFLFRDFVKTPKIPRRGSVDCSSSNYKKCYCSHSCGGPMRSVPPRGSGWVFGVQPVNPQVHGAPHVSLRSETHPLPHGGTDLVGPPHGSLPLFD